MHDASTRLEPQVVALASQFPSDYGGIVGLLQVRCHGSSLLLIRRDRHVPHLL